MIRKVRTAARQVGYLPDATARALRNGATRRVAFAVDEIGNPNYVSMLRAIESTFGGDGPHVSVTSTGPFARTAEVVRQAASGMADGLIISPIRVDEQLRRAIEDLVIPVVVIGSLAGSEAVDTVRVDSSRGVALAVDHVHEIGRRNMVFLNGPLDTNPGSARERGFFRAVHGLDLAENQYRQVVAADFTVAAGRAAIEPVLVERRRMRARDRVDAVVAANDLIAIGVIGAALAAGLRVPEDIAVTGVDDTEFAAAYNPTLTSVSLFAGRRGALAAGLLLSRFDEPHRDARSVEVSPELVIRRSTTPLPVGATY